MIDPMDFQDVVRRRRMVRSYADDPVDPAVVDRMLANAVRAPNAGFTQGWAFLVLDDHDDVRRFWAVTSDPDASNRWLDGMRTAPLVVVPMSSKAAYLDRYTEPDKGWLDREEHRWPVPYWHIDAGMAALLILQTAVDEGLGACFFGIPADRVSGLCAAFDVPGTHVPIGAITVGHPGSEPGAPGSPARRARRPLADVVHRGRWGAGGSVEDMTEAADESRIEHRSDLLPEEQVAGSEDPEAQARAILEESDERTDDPEGTQRESTQSPS